MTEDRKFKAAPRLWSAAAALVTAAAAGFALPAAAQDGPVKIGALMPLTGDLQAFGEADLNGVRLAVEQVSEAGGVLDGRQVEVAVGDTQTVPQAGIDAAQKLVSVDGVAGIVGALSSGVTIPVAKSVTSQARVPQVSPASTAPTITDLEDDGYLFRTVPSDAFQGVALAQVTQEAGYGNLAVLYVNNDYGEGLANSFKEAFEQAGGTVTAMAPFEQGKASYRGELQQLSQGGPEGLVLIAYPENGVTILRQALEEGYFDRFVFTDGMKTPDIVDQVGAEYLNGSIGTVAQSATDTDAHQRFREAFEERFGAGAVDQPYIDTSYDAAMLLLLAIEKAGTTEGQAVRDALTEVANPPGEQVLPGEWQKAKDLLAQGQDIDYVGASGSADFDEKGDVGGSFAHWAIEDGEIETVKVFEVGTM